jgi:poly-gamma-glutamate capsule biosynthesis protein CapA/YwtB (metallophosphatase superfamily)
MAHAIVDAGADLVLGHGAHMLQELELYHGKWIVYSLGNFVFQSRGRYQEKGVDAFSLVARLDVAEFDGGLHTILRLYPIACDNQVTNYQSYPVRQGEFQELSSLLLQRSPQRALLHAKWKAGTDGLGMHFLWTAL